MLERESATSALSSWIAGWDWLARGILSTESGVDLVLASRGEHRLAGVESLETRRAEFDESGTILEFTDDDAATAGLMRAAILAGRRVAAVFSTRGIHRAVEALRDLSVPMGAAGVIVVADEHWTGNARSDPRPLLAYLDAAVLCPSEPPSVARYFNESMRLSRATRRLASMWLSPMVLHGGETEATEDAALRPVSAGLDAASASHDPIWQELRRRQMDRAINLPVPGERAPLGFIAAGAAFATLRHALYMLGLSGRLPVLRPACIHPIDPHAVEAMLTRCERVIVVEPGGSFVHREVMLAAVRLVQAGKNVAEVSWWRDAMPESGAGSAVAGNGEATTHTSCVEPHPSDLARIFAVMVPDIRALDGKTVREHWDSHYVFESASAGVAFPTRRDGVNGGGLIEAIARSTLALLRDELAEPAIDRTALDVEVAPLETASFASREGRRLVVEMRRRDLIGPKLAMVRHAVRRDAGTLFLVYPDDGEPAAAPERPWRSVAIAAGLDPELIEVLDASDGPNLHRVLRHALIQGRPGILILQAPRIAPPPTEWMERWIRPSSAEVDFCYEWLVRHGWSHPSLLDGRRGPRIELPESRDPSWTPLDGWDGFEEVAVRRGGPTAAVPMSATDLPNPTLRHSREPFWRAHICGRQREGVEQAAELLAESGWRTGHRVQILRGRDASGWFAQLCFSRTRDDGSPWPVSARIPRGTADLIVGLDWSSVFAAVEEGGIHRAGSAGRTWLVMDLSAPPGLPAGGGHSRIVVPAEMSTVAPPMQRIVLLAEESCERWLGSRRNAPAALVGVAFQQGVVPVSLDALRRSAERMGDGAETALTLGRWLALGPGNGPEAERTLEWRPEAAVRRHRAVIAARWRWRAGRRARRFEQLALGALDSVSGLRRRDRGRLAERRFVERLIDLEVWGGLPACQTYVERIRAIYAAERPMEDFTITRLVIPELARAMLIADPIFVAATVLRPDRRRADERRLGVARRRGERMRIRLRGRSPLLSRWWGRGYWRAGRWGMRMLSLVRPLRRWPAWRRADKEYARWVVELVDRCSGELPHRRSLWTEVFRQLSRVRGHGVRRRARIRHVRRAVEALLEIGAADLAATPDASPATAPAVEASIDPPGETGHGPS